MEIIKYNHHGKDVFVKGDLKGKHRNYCLCFECKKLNITDRDKNCHIANIIFDNCVKYGITTPVFECGEFE